MESPILIIPHYIEIFIMVLTASLVFNFFSNIKTVLLCVTVNTIALYIIRSLILILDFPMGANMVIMIFVFTTTLTIFFRLSLRKAIGSTLFIFILLVSCEIIILPINLNITGWTPKDLFNSQFKYILISVLDLIPFFLIIAYQLYKKVLLFENI